MSARTADATPDQRAAGLHIRQVALIPVRTDRQPVAHHADEQQRPRLGPRRHAAHRWVQNRHPIDFSQALLNRLLNR